MNSVSMSNVADLVHEAGDMIETAGNMVHKAADIEHNAAPYLEGFLPLIPGIGLPAAAVVRGIDQAVPYLVQAFDLLVKAFHGDDKAAGKALADYLTPGRTNAKAIEVLS
jgi:hypothetical protein